MNSILMVLVGIGLVLNVWVTFLAIRSQLFENKQKWLQVLMIWLLPIVGALLVWHFARDTLPRKSTYGLNGHESMNDGDIRLENYSSDIFVGHDGGDSGGGDH